MVPDCRRACADEDQNFGGVFGLDRRVSAGSARRRDHRRRARRRHRFSHGGVDVSLRMNHAIVAVEPVAQIARLLRDVRGRRGRVGRISGRIRRRAFRAWRKHQRHNKSDLEKHAPHRFFLPTHDVKQTNAARDGSTVRENSAFCGRLRRDRTDGTALPVRN